MVADLVWRVFWVSLLTAAATGFGALPFVFVRTLLIPDSLERCSRGDTAWGAIVGLLAMLWMMVGLGM